MFDISENKRKIRNLLRFHLKKLVLFKYREVFGFIPIRVKKL